MTKYQLERGMELKEKIEVLVAAHLTLKERPLKSRAIPYIELTEEANRKVKDIAVNDLENQIKQLNKELEEL